MAAGPVPEPSGGSRAADRTTRPAEGMGEAAGAALDRFLGYLQARNASPGTIREYRRNAGEFLAHLHLQGVDWTRPSRIAVRAYLAGLADRGLAATSVGGRLAAIRSFYRHAAREGWIEADPMAGVRSPRKPGRLPRVLTVPEAERLVEAPQRRTLQLGRGVSEPVAIALRSA